MRYYFIFNLNSTFVLVNTIFIITEARRRRFSYNADREQSFILKLVSNLQKAVDPSYNVFQIKKKLIKCFVFAFKVSKLLLVY